TAPARSMAMPVRSAGVGGSAVTSTVRIIASFMATTEPSAFVKPPSARPVSASFTPSRPRRARKYFRARATVCRSRTERSSVPPANTYRHEKVSPRTPETGSPARGTPTVAGTESRTIDSHTSRVAGPAPVRAEPWATDASLPPDDPPQAARSASPATHAATAATMYLRTIACNPSRGSALGDGCRFSDLRARSVGRRCGGPQAQRRGNGDPPAEPPPEPRTPPPHPPRP